MTKIIGISGKKQSGKNTSSNILHGIRLKSLGRIADWKIDENGKLLVLTDDSSGIRDWGVFDVDRRDRAFTEYANKNMFPYIKSYAVADGLKDICINYFGLAPNQVKGSDEEKNRPTHLRWEDMPGVIVDEKSYNAARASGMSSNNVIFKHAGYVTGREFMQFLGTDIMRKMYENVWVQNVMSRIRSEKSEFAVITDLRFPNEADAVVDDGGIIVRLNRDVYDSDHSSELAMDDYDQSKYSMVIDNHKNIEVLVSEISKLAEALGL